MRNILYLGFDLEVHPFSQISYKELCTKLSNIFILYFPKFFPLSVSEYILNDVHLQLYWPQQNSMQVRDGGTVGAMGATVPTIPYGVKWFFFLLNPVNKLMQFFFSGINFP